MTSLEFTQRTLIVVGLVMLAALVSAILVIAADVLLVLFGGVLLAVLLRGLADQLQEHSPLSERTSVVLVVAIFLVGLLLGLWFLGAEIVRQVDELSANAMDTWRQIREKLRSDVWGRRLLELITRAPSDGAGGEMAGPAASAFSTTLGALTNMAIVVFVGVYVCANPHWYRRGLLKLAPPAQRSRVQHLLDDLGRTLRWWLFGRAVSMAVVGLATGVGLWLLDVPLAFALGLIAGALDFVPFIGPIVAAAPALLIAFSEGPTTVAYVAALYLVIQFLEGYVVTPLIAQRTVHLPPAVTIGSQVILGVLVGAVGVVLAQPLAAVLLVIIKQLYVEEALEHAPHAAR